MKRISKKLMKSQRGASLAEYAMIVALLSLIAVIAVPGVSIGIKRMSCEVISLHNNTFDPVTGGCVHRNNEVDLGGENPGFMVPYW